MVDGQKTEDGESCQGLMMDCLEVIEGQDEAVEAAEDPALDPVLVEAVTGKVQDLKCVDVELVIKISQSQFY